MKKNINRVNFNLAFAHAATMVICTFSNVRGGPVSMHIIRSMAIKNIENETSCHQYIVMTKP